MNDFLFSVCLDWKSGTGRQSVDFNLRSSLSNSESLLSNLLSGDLVFSSDCFSLRISPWLRARSSWSTLERRLAESARIREKYQDRIPVIVERAEKSDVPNIDKKKYLVPADLTVGQFVYVVRKRIKLSPEKAIFIFVKNNTLPPTAALMSGIYDENKDEDGFLYTVYSGENTFGIC